MDQQTVTFIIAIIIVVVVAVGISIRSSDVLGLFAPGILSVIFSRDVRSETSPITKYD